MSGEGDATHCQVRSANGAPRVLLYLQSFSLSVRSFVPCSVYVADEATASVDPGTDAKVHELLMSLPATVISICHRLEVGAATGVCARTLL